VSVYYTGETESFVVYFRSLAGTNVICSSSVGGSPPFFSFSSSFRLFCQFVEDRKEEKAVMEMHFRSRLSIKNHAVFSSSSSSLYATVRVPCVAVVVSSLRGMMMAVVVGGGRSIFFLLIAT
jgi:hypothetical protein